MTSRRRAVAVGAALALGTGALALAHTGPVAAASVAGALQGGATLELAVGGVAGVPTGAAAAALNMTVTDTTAPGYLTVWPCGNPRPTASNLNYTAGDTIPNLVIAKLGTAGKICIYAQTTTHVIADLAGYFPTTTAYTPTPNPERLLDTRNGATALAGNTTLELAVGGVAGVPTGAAAAALNMTVTDTAAPGYLTVWPCGNPRPTASNLNYTAGDTIPNLVIAKLGTAGKICIYAQTTTHVIADLAGYFPTTTAYTPTPNPERLLDTRNGATALAGNTTLELAVGGVAGVPTGAAAAALNMTVTDTTAPGYLTVWPCGNPRPTASNLNYTAGDTIPNLVIAKLGTAGKICIYAQTTTHVIADLAGYFPTTTAYTPTPNPERLLDTRNGAKVTPTITPLQTSFTYPGAPIPLAPGFKVTPAVPLAFVAIDRDILPNGPFCTTDAGGNLVLVAVQFLALPHTCRVTATATATATTELAQRIVDITVERRPVALSLVGDVTVAPPVGGLHDVTFRIRFDPPIIQAAEEAPGSTCTGSTQFAADRDLAVPSDFVVTVVVPAAALPCTLRVRNAFQDQLLDTDVRAVGIAAA